MPTSKPRYALTDTGPVARTLDEAAERWPELAADRKALLMRVLHLGARALARDRLTGEGVSAAERRLAVTRRLPDLVDVDALLDDAAWR